MWSVAGTALLLILSVPVTAAAADLPPPADPASLPRVYNVKLGKHTVRIFAIDAAGNADPTPALFRFRVRRR